MFSIAVSPTYVAPVKGALAGGVPFEFEAVFRRFSVPELRALDERVASGGLTDEQLIVHVLAGWNGVADESGTELPFSPANLERLLCIHGVTRALLDAFYTSLSEARRKN